MKLKLTFIILFLSLFALNYANESLIQRINRYSGKNANALLTYLDSLSGLKSYYTDYIINHMSDNDLATASPEYIDEHITYALKTLDLPYTADIPEDYFLHFVLPLRVSQEPFEEWRKEFYDKLYPQVSQVQTINEAILIADLFYQEGIYFKQTSGRDQGPLTSIKRGYGRCEEMMILQMAVFRAVGIPCRPASAPYWSFTDSNHVWTEVWTPQGWRIVPEAYPLEYRKSSWEVDRARKAPLITSQAFGSYDSSSSLQKTKYDTKINISDVYGDIVTTEVIVVDQANKPVPDAQVIYYATSFGGLFDMLEINTDENGIAKVDFRPTSVFVTAGKDGKSAYGLINSFTNSNTIKLTLSDNNIIEDNLILNFPLDSSADKNFQLTPENKQYINNLTELANKKRENRLLTNKKGLNFLKNYPLPKANENSYDYKLKRDNFLNKCQELAGNADNWLSIDAKISDYPNPEVTRNIMIDLIINWDIKDLIELPDEKAIENLLLTLSDSRIYYQDIITNDLFISNVILFPLGTNPFPQTGWQTDLYKITKDLRSKKIDQTIKNIDQWLKENTVHDNHPSWSYFGGSLTPLQYINKKYLSRSQQIYLTAALIQNAGIPIRWQGFLEYYNGTKWIEIIMDDSDEDNDTPPVARKLVEFELKITIDDKAESAKPWGNFLIASQSDNGHLTYDWFDFAEVNDTFIVKFYQEENKNKYIQGFIRNKNGDANLIIKPLAENTSTLVMDFKTPMTSHENLVEWSEETLANIDNLRYNASSSSGKSLLMILNEQGNEPQERMLEQLLNNLGKFNEKQVQVIVYSENRLINKLTEIKQDSFVYLQGPEIINEDIKLDNYPILFLLENDQLVSSANGFDLDLINYLLRLVD
jgi:hypothetical protein